MVGSAVQVFSCKMSLNCLIFGWVLGREGVSDGMRELPMASCSLLVGRMSSSTRSLRLRGFDERHIGYEGR